MATLVWTSSSAAPLLEHEEDNTSRRQGETKGDTRGDSGTKSSWPSIVSMQELRTPHSKAVWGMQTMLDKTVLPTQDQTPPEYMARCNHGLSMTHHEKLVQQPSSGAFPLFCSANWPVPNLGHSVHAETEYCPCLEQLRQVVRYGIKLRSSSTKCAFEPSIYAEFLGNQKNKLSYLDCWSCSHLRTNPQVIYISC